MEKREENMLKISDWQEKFQHAVDEFSEEHELMKRGKLQYNGKLQPEKGSGAKTIYNFTKELVESAIDTTVPMPKVEPYHKTEKNIRLARTIEAMLLNEIKRINLDPINDVDERNTKMTGGDVVLIEWNNQIKTPWHVGDIDLRIINPMRFTPQPGVYDIERMDYFFLDFEDTKEKIREVYGVDVYDESVDTSRADENPEDETVTMKWAFYKNKKGHLGIFAWAGETVVIDDDNYQARAEEVCQKCGRQKPAGESKCLCGSTKWISSHLDYETLENDIRLSDGSIIPKMSYARDENGDYDLRPTVMPVTETNEMGQELQVYEQIFDEMMNPVGERPVLRTEMLPYMENTEIPYYVPKSYPVCLRKNVSVDDRVFGESDCAAIEEVQIEANKILKKLFRKVDHNGQILSKLSRSRFNFDNDIQVIEVDSLDELNAIKNFDLRFDSNSDLNLVNQLYYWAKSLLGINDSSQGKADTTAKSGRAKEAQIARAQARQSSKIVMKNAFYQKIYKSMFEFALAYMDEAREYSYKSPTGDDEEIVFNRYDFLEIGPDGKYHYNDQFAITIDQMAGITESRETMLEMMQADYQAGLYGNIQDPETTLAFWKDRESMNYPNAARQVARWEVKVEEFKRMQEVMSQQPPINGGGQTSGDPGGEVIDQMQM